jgi:hypothetical protein
MTTLNGVLHAATRSANSNNDLAIAAGEVIAKRVALGVAAAFDPMQADHAEFGRMVPEKMEAFSAASMIMLEHSSQAGLTMTRLASDEVMKTAQASLSIADWMNPIAMVTSPGLMALDWFNRAAANFFTMGLLALGAHEAALVPIQQTIASNAARLSRG